MKGDNFLELRYLENFKLEKAIMHIVMQSSREPVFSESLVESEEITEEFLPGHILKVLGDFENMKAEFVRKSPGSTADTLNQMLEDDEFFIEDSKQLAKQLALSTMDLESISSYGIIVAKLTAQSESKCIPLVAVLKADFHSTYAHSVMFEEEEVKIGIVKTENTLPSGSKKVSNCAVIKPYDDTGYQILLLNKKVRDEDGVLIDYFVEKFLGADYVMDDTSKTVKIHGAVEKWIRKVSKDEISKGIESREVLDRTFSDGAKAGVAQLVYAITDSNDEKEMLEETLSMGGIDPEEDFQIDKRYIEKKFKSRQIKTNTGFTLKAEREIFRDSSRFDIVYNGDGTVNYVIKNVRNVSER